MLYELDLLGTFVFALSGAMRAARKELDVLGVLVLAVATGAGGGILRDVLLGVAPPAAFRNETYLIVCLVAGVAVFFAAGLVPRRWHAMLLFDALGLGLFAALGAAAGANHGLGPVGTIFMATTTACGGGVVRDILANEVPVVLRTDFYATAAILGGLAYVLARHWGLDANYALSCCALVTIVLRLAAMWTGFTLPRAKLPPDRPTRE